MSTGVRAERLGVCFLFDRQDRVVTPAASKIRGRKTTVWGLRDVDLAIGPGEGLALIGATGSGKSTMLRVLASVLIPDAGRLDVRGRVGSLLSVHAGLLTALTGRENSILLGVLAGLSRRDSRAIVGRVKERSGLGDAFERSVSSYSQGMRARLGFAVAEAAEPEVLLLDEVHEVVDREFHEVMEDSARAIRDAGGIVVAAGHDHDVLARMCDRAVLFERGRVRANGPFDEVLAVY